MEGVRTQKFSLLPLSSVMYIYIYVCVYVLYNFYNIICNIYYFCPIALFKLKLLSFLSLPKVEP